MNHKSNFREYVIYRMLKVIKLVLFLIIGVTPSIALAQLFSDSAMNPSGWNSQLCPNVPSTTANSAFQINADTTTGNPTAPSLKIIHTYDRRAFVCHLKNGATVNPSAASISNIEFSMYGKIDSFSVKGHKGCIGLAMVLRQNGVYFRGSRINDVCITDDVGTGWKFGHNYLIASDFNRTDLDNNAQPQHPDFSCAGAPIDLGFTSYNQTGEATLVGTPQKVVGHVDEWSADVTSYEACPPNLTITKTAVEPVPWQAGGTGAYQVVVTNTGGSIASGTIIVLKDNGNFPSPPLNLSGITGEPGWDCTSTPGQCSYTVPPNAPVASGTIWNFTVNVTIASDYDGGKVKNCAELTMQAAGSPEIQDSSCAMVPIEGSKPPVITKTAVGPMPWQAGGTGTFSISVNVPSGISSNQSIAIQDVLPVGFAFIPSSITPAGVWDCNQSTGTCYLNGPIAAGTTVNITFDVQLPKQQCGTFKNCADVDVTEHYNPKAPPIFNSEGQSCVGIEVAGCTDSMCVPAMLNITKMHQPAIFVSGGTGSIGITVSNNGSTPVFAPIQVIDQLPAGLSMTPGSFSPSADLACVAGPVSPPPQQINCSYMGAALSAGGSFSIPLQVKVSPRARKSVKNHASVTKGCCGSEVNDTTTDNIPVHRITHPPIDPLPIKTGQICGKKVNARNEGLSGWAITATNQATSHTYGPVATTGNGTYCIANLPAGNYTVSEQIPGLLNGWIWGAVNPASGSYSSIHVAAGQVKLGVNFKNKKKKIIGISVTPIRGQPLKPAANGGGISITKKHSPSHFSTGSRGAFKIVVKNKGSKLAKGMLTLVDHMPVGLSVKMGDFRANSWRCKGGMVSSSGQDVTCTYNRALGKNSRATLNLNVAIASADRFPADVNEVENCVTPSLNESPGMAINRSNSHIKGDVKVEKAAKRRGMAMRVCDKVKIRRAKTSGSFNLPIGIGIGLGGLGSGGGGGSKRGAAR